MELVCLILFILCLVLLFIKDKLEKKLYKAESEISNIISLTDDNLIGSIDDYIILNYIRDGVNRYRFNSENLKRYHKRGK